MRSAEDGAAYDARRTDGTSTHYFHDQDSTIQCVRTGDRAHAAYPIGNGRGIHHELCGRAGQSAGQWHDAASAGTLRQAARQVARDAAKWGIPLRRLSVDQVRGYQAGICGHVDISYAFHESDHTDPGTNFPWSEFLAMVHEAAGDDMPLTTADLAKITDAVQAALETNRAHDAIARSVWMTDGIISAPGDPRPGKNPDGTDVNTHWGAATYFKQTHDRVKAGQEGTSAVLFLLRQLASTDQVDEKALAATLAPLVAEEIVVRMPDVSQGEVTTAVQEAFAKAFTKQD